MSNPLFSNYDVMAITYTEKQGLREIVDKLAASEFEAYDAETLTERVMNDLMHQRPTILQDQWYADQRNCQVDVSRDPMRNFIDRNQPFYVAGVEIEIHVPFEGDPDYFGIQPTIWSTAGYPVAGIDDNELVFTYRGETLDGAAVQNRVLGELGEINKYLDSINGTLQQHYAEIRPQIRDLMRARIGKLKKAADLGTSLGIPIRKKDGVATAFPIPMPKRNVPRVQHTPTSSAAKPPEPILADNEYEYILSVLKYMSTVMEQHPDDFRTLGEEALRTQFLVQLNGQYHGQATGETFNYSGKTDILLKAEGRNVFVAECKIWKGEAVLLSTIDQLLSYLGWRDTKAAILIFNRNKSFTSVLNTIREGVPKHEGFVEARGEYDESSFIYRFRHATDRDREMLLTVMAFDVPA